MTTIRVLNSGHFAVNTPKFLNPYAQILRSRRPKTSNATCLLVYHTVNQHKCVLTLIKVA